MRRLADPRDSLSVRLPVRGRCVVHTPERIDRASQPAAESAACSDRKASPVSSHRKVLVSVSAAAVALLGAQLGSSAAAATPHAAAGISVTVPATTTVGTASTITAAVPGDTVSRPGSIILDVNALGALPAADLTVTETTGTSMQTITLSNAASDGGTPTDAVGSAAITLPANASQTTTFSVTPTSATGVRGQLAIFVQFDSTATDSDGHPLYEVDNHASTANNITQIPKATPYKVQQYVAVSRPSATDHANDVYYASTASGGTAYEVNAGGLAGDQVLVGDAFGSGDDYPVVYRPVTSKACLAQPTASVCGSTWYEADQFEDVGGVATASDYESFRFGEPGDIPLIGAFPTTYKTGTPNYGSSDTIAVWRPSNQTFYIDGGAKTGLRWGQKGDIPVAGCWDGTQDAMKDAGCDSIGVFRPSNHTFYLLTLANKEIIRSYGLPGDKPVIGDWNGSGTSLIAIDRNGSFYLAANNTNGAAGAPIAWGRATDRPLSSFTSTIPDLTAILAAEDGSNARTAKAVAAAQPVHATVTPHHGTPMLRNPIR